MRSECDPRDTGGIRQVNEDTLDMEDFKSCTGGIIGLRESVFVTDEQRGKVDPPFQFSLDSSETLDGDAFLAGTAASIGGVRCKGVDVTIDRFMHFLLRGPLSRLIGVDLAKCKTFSLQASFRKLDDLRRH